MKTNIEARPMYSGFTQLTWSWFFTTIISLSAFFGTHSIFFKPTIAVMTTLTVLAAAFLFCLRIAWQEKTSMVWQYIASQVVFIGAVYAGVASLFVSGWFVVATIIYGGATFILMFFNLSGGPRSKPTRPTCPYIPYQQ